MSEAYKKLIKTLQTIFEMDKADLDFGIYRIMNQKREEINRFLEHDLLPQVKEAFADYAKGGKSEVQAELDQLINTLTEAGMDPEQSPKVKELREKAKTSVDMVALENEVYSHLHTFFSRYYDKGDFISQRRYKKDTYAIPYEGEEVKLYWANQDQYYIKSSEHLRDYAFIACDESGKTVRIKLVEADTEKDNVKAESGKERRFVLDAERPLSVENGELHIRFHYIPAGKQKQDALNKKAVETILKQPGFEEWMPLLRQKAPTEKNPERTLLEKHLNEYTARNTFDYFIHKDLGGFLRRELDFYIKNEVLYLDDIDDAAFAVTEQHLRKIKVIRTIAHKIIRILAQLEDFQKKLWLKKKFVVETNYCITVGNIPETFYPEIAACEEQWEEWRQLCHIHALPNDMFSSDLATPEGRVAFLKAHPTLVLDTRHFGANFTDRLLASFEDLDEMTDGLLVHSENWQALNLLQEKYRERVKCVYIDPPYNTGSDGFVYKDNYQHSSWLAMSHDRAMAARHLLADDGLLTCSIGDHELDRLRLCLSAIFDQKNMLANFIWNNEGNIDNQSRVKKNHEYILAFCKDETKYPHAEVIAPDIRSDSKLYNDTIENSITKNGPGNPPSEVQLPEGFPATFEEGEIDFQEIAWPHLRDRVIVKDSRLVKPARVYSGWSSRYLLDKYIANDCKPIQDSKGLETWFKLTHTGAIYCYKKRERQSHVLSVIRGVGTVKTMSGQLAHMGFDFSYPKPINLIEYVCKWTNHRDALILDFFAGSGTTGHAVINLNREDAGRRKFILVEMGEYFDTVLLPRLKKVTFSPEWKNSKPKRPAIAEEAERSPRIIKVIRLESYEDTLNNLILKPRTKQQEELLKHHDLLREDYMLGYWLELETEGSPSLLNIEQFEDPFNYQLNIATGSAGATRPTRVDLVETFNYLIGLTVKHIDRVRGFKVITGTNPKGESVLVIWRNLMEKDNAALEAFMDKSGYNPRDTEYEHIYVNGDHTLEDPHSKVKMIEIEFKRLMFDVQNV